jgi:uncharacterized membrane protein
MKKESLLTFNDGVIAIIITLMVLDIKLPGSGVADYRGMLLHIGIYAISFVMVAILWVNLHAMLDRIECVGPKAIWRNLLVLFCMSLTPLPPEAVGEHPRDVSSHVFMASVMLLVALMYAFRHHAIEDQWALPVAARRELSRKNWMAVGLFAVAIPLAFVSTWISLAIFIAVPALYFLPSKHLVREAE